MRYEWTLRILLTSACFLGALLHPESAGADNPTDSQQQWPQWRGPLATGVAPHGDPPIQWSETENVRWKIPLPGLGHSTPILWGDRLFLTTAIAHGETLEAPPEHDHGAHHNLPASRRQRFVVLAVDRATGEILWQTTVRDEQPHEGTHETGSWASNSPVTDGQQIYAFFGSRGLHSLNLDGKIVWRKDFGDMLTRHGHGEGASPAIFGDTLIVNWDHQGESFVAAINKQDGEERWRVARDEMTSWSTPLVVEHGGKPQVIVSATGRVRSYDLATGRVIWEVGGLSRNVVASPVAGDGLVIVGGSYDWQKMLAVRLEGARGDLTGTESIVWSRDRHAPYVPSPLLYDGQLYFLKHSHAFLMALDAKTGEEQYGPVRIRGLHNIFASPVAAAGRIYITSREGTTAVVRSGPEPELLAINRLNDAFSASPVVAGHELFLRGEEYLYGLAIIQEPPPPATPSSTPTPERSEDPGSRSPR